MSTNHEKVKISFNGKTYVKKLDLTESRSLLNVRKQLGNTFLDYVFVDGDDEVLLDDEEDWVIEDIIKDGILYIRPKPKEETFQESKTKELPKQTPIDGSEHLGKKGNLDIYLYPSKRFSAIEESQSLSMMVVGETGTGKTTLLNSLVNYLTGIQYEDDFRYLIIKEETKKSQAKSQTSEVNIYYISSHNGNPPIKIIDTPGFGDTNGIEEDQKIPDRIKETFSNENNGINTINAICFVLKSSLNRLTTAQIYIFQSVINIFGKDVAQNFIALLTFFNNSTPTIVSDLTNENPGSSDLTNENPGSSEEEKITEEEKAIKKIFSNLKEQNLKEQKSWYFLFNNSAIFEKPNDDLINKEFWKKAMYSYQQLIDKLKTLPPRSLTLTLKVLSHRDNLKRLADQLQKELDRGIVKLNKLKVTLQQIEMSKARVEDSKDYNVPYTRHETKKINLPPGSCVTTCLKCHHICHDDCCIKLDKDKKNCCVMDQKTGKCKVCGCDWFEHFNLPHYWEEEDIPDTRVNPDLYSKYQEAVMSERQYQDEKKNILDQMKEVFSKCITFQQTIIECYNELASIALNPNVLSSSKYFDLLIATEKGRGEKCDQRKIDGYEALKKTQISIDKAVGRKFDIRKFEYEKQKIINGQFDPNSFNIDQCNIC